MLSADAVLQSTRLLETLRGFSGDAVLPKQTLKNVAVLAQAFADAVDASNCGSTLKSLSRELIGHVSTIHAAHVQYQEGMILDAQLKRWNGLIECEQRQLFSAERRSEILQLKRSGVEEMNHVVRYDVERTMAELQHEAVEHLATVDRLESRLRSMQKDVHV
ncbi:hypothetical protein C8T65DRAFT_737263 [Cerioporus squamosus]|nr:hypothetical protein C8T65DRAFT_737263 [Cerioporus squamosus]